MDLNIRDKVFAIVGGTGGMGLETARLLAAEGARVAVIGRSLSRGGPRAQALAQETGADVRMFEADGTLRRSVETAIDRIAHDFGRLDGLAVTAGTMQTRQTLANVDDDTWQAYFEEHVMMTVRACRAAIPHIIASGGGTVVTTAAYSIRAQKPVLMGYSTMKAAVASFTKNIALTYGGQGVRANTICPGFIASESAEPAMTAAARKYDLPPMAAINRALSEDFKMNVALGRVGLPEELADLYVFLLSPRAGYLTGALINADGGTQF